MSGFVYTAGDNGYPLLGTGNSGTVHQVHTVASPSLIFKKVIRAGNFNYPARVGITADGKLYYWGYRAWTSSKPFTYTPIQDTAYSDWVDIAATDAGLVGIRSNGTLYSKGYSSYGETGRSPLNSWLEWGQVGSATNWVQVASTLYGTYAINASGELWGCGYNGTYEQGNGGTGNVTTLTRIGTKTYSKITPNTYVGAVAIDTDGKLFGWGSRANFQLDGTSSSGYYTTPTQLHVDTDWSGVFASHNGFIALKPNGDVYATGKNYTLSSSGGSLGMGAVDTVAGWTLNPYINDVKYVYTQQHKSFFIKNNGDVYASGVADSYGLGNSSTTAHTTVPVAVAVGKKAIAVYGSVGFLQQHQKYQSLLLIEPPMEGSANLLLDRLATLVTSGPVALAASNDMWINREGPTYLSSTGIVGLFASKTLSLKRDYAWPIDNPVSMFGGSVGAIHSDSLTFAINFNSSVNLSLTAYGAGVGVDPALVRECASVRSMAMYVSLASLTTYVPVPPGQLAASELFSMTRTAVLGVSSSSYASASMSLSATGKFASSEVSMQVNGGVRQFSIFATGRLADDAPIVEMFSSCSSAMSSVAPTLGGLSVGLVAEAAVTTSSITGTFVPVGLEVFLANEYWSTWGFLNQWEAYPYLSGTVSLEASANLRMRVRYAVINRGGKYTTKTLYVVSPNEVPLAYAYDDIVTFGGDPKENILSVDVSYVAMYYDRYNTWPQDPSTQFGDYPRFRLGKLGGHDMRLDMRLAVDDPTYENGYNNGLNYYEVYNYVGDFMLPEVSENALVGYSLPGNWTRAVVGNLWDDLKVYVWEMVVTLDPDIQLDGSAAMSMSAIGLDVDVPISGSAVCTITIGSAVRPTAPLTVTSGFGYIINDGESVSFDYVFIKDGQDITSSVFGDFLVSKERDSARIAEFSYKAPAGVFDPTTLIGQDVSIDYVSYVNDSPYESYRLFTGKVQRIDIDIGIVWVRIFASDDLQVTLDTMEKPAIDALTPTAMWSSFLFDSEATGWEYLEDRLSTVPYSVDKDVYGNLMYYDWFADSSPYYVFGVDDDVMDESVKVKVADRASLINQYTVEFQYRYPRLAARRRCFGWSYDGEYFTYQGSNPFSVPLFGLNMHDAISAFDSGGWELDRYGPVPKNANYTPVYDLYAVAHKRYTRRMTETYTMVVQAQDSIVKNGVLPAKASFSGEVTYDEGSWLDNPAAEPVLLQADGAISPHLTTPSYGAYTRSLYTVNAFGDSADVYYDVVNQEADGEEQLAYGIRCAYGYAYREIIKAHSQNTVTFSTIWVYPTIETTATIGIAIDGVQATGRVLSYTHHGSMDEGGVSSTEIVLSMMRGNEGGPFVPIADFPEFVRAPLPMPDTPTSCTVLPNDVRVVNTPAYGYSDVLSMFDWDRDGLTVWMTGPYLVQQDDPDTSEVEPTIFEWQVEQAQFKVSYPDIDKADADHTELDPVPSVYNFNIPNDPFTVVAQ